MIDAYCTDRVTILAHAGRDEWGEPLGEPTSHLVRGRVEWKTRLVRDLHGETVASPIRVYLSLRRVDRLLGRALTHEDRIVVDGRDRAILAIAEPKAFSGPHYEIDLA